MEGNILAIKGLSKNYKGFSLSDINLQLPYGCIMGLIGENGAGKSTTIKAILGLIHTNGGVVTIFGSDWEKEGEVIREDIGVVLGELNLPATFNSKEICRMMKGIYRNWSSETYFAYLERFRIDKNKKIKDYSRGMKMKAALAIALSHKAKLLILDEPTSGLDPVIREDVLNILREFVMEEEHSILISSHIISDLEKAADYVAFLHNGHMSLCGEKDRLLEEHRLFKGSREELNKLEAAGRAAVVGVRENNFGLEALLKDVRISTGSSNFLLEAAGLEDIMLYMVKGERR